MSGVNKYDARAVADLGEGYILASVEVTASPERTFRALLSQEILAWWVRPGVFDTREWSGDVRVGGRWEASGIGGGRPYTLEGVFLEIDPPRKLAHTWHGAGTPGAPTTVTYLLEPIGEGTRITLRHAGFSSREQCMATCLGWETSFEQLAAVLAADMLPGRAPNAGQETAGSSQQQGGVPGVSTSIVTGTEKPAAGQASAKYVVHFVTRYPSLNDAKVQAPDVIAEHLARTKEFHARGVLMMAGAFLDRPAEPLSTMAILATRQAAEEYARGDPFLLKGMISTWYVREWADMLAAPGRNTELRAAE